MKINISKKLLFLLVFLTLSCSSSLRLQQVDFYERESDWRSFRDEQCNFPNRYIEIPFPLELLWKKKVGPSYLTPLILDKMVIIGSLENKITFLDLNSGEELGKYSLSHPIYITPCVDGSLLYFPEVNGDNYIFALNLKEGDPVWNRTLHSVSSCPVIFQEKLFVGTERGELICLNKENGGQLWEYKTNGFIYSTPIFNKGTLYFGSGDRNIYCLDVNSGKLIWNHKATGAIYVSPCMNDKAIFLGSADGNFYALDLSTGKLVWEFKTDGSIRSSAVLSEGMVFFGSNDGNLYALSTEEGKLIWRFKADGPIHSSPVIAGDKIFFGSLDGNFYGLTAQNGNMVFKFKTGGMIYASPSFSRGKILIPSTDKYLYCFGTK